MSLRKEGEEPSEGRRKEEKRAYDVNAQNDVGIGRRRQTIVSNAPPLAVTAWARRGATASRGAWRNMAGRGLLPPSVIVTDVIWAPRLYPWLFCLCFLGGRRT